MTALRGLEWPEALAVLAERVAVDTGRPVAEVAEILERCHDAGDSATSADVAELVDLLTPTMARVCGPAMRRVVEQVAELPLCLRVEILAPMVSTVLPALVFTVLAEAGAAGA